MTPEDGKKKFMAAFNNVKKVVDTAVDKAVTEIDRLIEDTVAPPSPPKKKGPRRFHL